MQEIDETAEVLLLTDRELHGNHAFAESGAEAIDRPVKIGVFPTHAVDEDHPGDAGVAGESPAVFRADFDGGCGIRHDQRGFGHAYGRLDLADKIRIPGRINQVDLRITPFERCHRRGDRHSALDLILVIVTDSISIFRLTHASGCVGGEEHCLNKGRFSGTAVTDHSHIADVFRGILFQGKTPRHDATARRMPRMSALALVHP